MRIVGNRNRTEIELDPQQAYLRGRELDAMLRRAAPPVQRGCTRGSHAHFERLDLQRQVQMARVLNSA
jgi:hypothetical protein